MPHSVNRQMALTNSASNRQSFHPEGDRPQEVLLDTGTPIRFCYCKEAQNRPCSGTHPAVHQPSLLHQLEPSHGLNELLTNPTVFQLGRPQSEHSQQSNDQTTGWTDQRGDILPGRHQLLAPCAWSHKLPNTPGRRQVPQTHSCRSIGRTEKTGLGVPQRNDWYLL